MVLGSWPLQAVADSHCAHRPRRFWRALGRYSIECFSIWACLMFRSDLHFFFFFKDFSSLSSFRFIEKSSGKYRQSAQPLSPPVEDTFTGPSAGGTLWITEFQPTGFTDENRRLGTLKPFPQGHTVATLRTIHPFWVCFSIASKLILCNLRDGFVIKVLNSENFVRLFFFFFNF